ncbi:MAG: DUF1963 domain-containing protein [Bacteroidota bacterium]
MGKILDIFMRRDKKQAVSWEDIKDILEPYRKPAWFPKVVEKKSSISSSKFSGVPILQNGENWPCCEHCNEPMQLFLQLYAKHLPDEADTPFGNGVLQVFYCTNQSKECEVVCEAYFPYSTSTLVRVINPDNDDLATLTSNPVKDAFPEKEIVGWEVKDDYPNWEELEVLGCTLTDEQSDYLCEIGYPQSKDKLLGWPYWVQSVEYPDCPDCGKPMKLIFQIDSENNLPYMFGDVGCSHVTQCDQHKDKMAIAWACC